MQDSKNTPSVRDIAVNVGLLTRDEIVWPNCNKQQEAFIKNTLP